MTQEPIWQPSDISVEAGAEGDGPKRRGRIPQSSWPRILEMYKGGATLSAIAREFECTPSAISYILRKAESGGADGGADTSHDEGAGGSDRPATEAPARQAAPPPERAPERRPEQQDLPMREARPERQERRPLTMGANGPHPQAPARSEGEGRRPDPHPAEGRAAGAPQQARPPEIRHSDGRSGDPRPEGRQDARPQRPQQERGFEGRQGEARGEQRGFGNRPPRDDNRPPRDDNRPPRDDHRPMRDARYGDMRHSQEDAEDFSDIGRFNRPAGHAAYPYRQQRNAARQEAQETPSEPADQRMDAAAKTCAELYRTWKANGGEDGMQALSDALHEMRKVIARMEIEMSASRREEQRPVPIPAYRLNQPAPQQPRG